MIGRSSYLVTSLVLGGECRSASAALLILFQFTSVRLYLLYLVTMWVMKDENNDKPIMRMNWNVWQEAGLTNCWQLKPTRWHTCTRVARFPGRETPAAAVRPRVRRRATSCSTCRTSKLRPPSQWRHSDMTFAAAPGSRPSFRHRYQYITSSSAITKRPRYMVRSFWPKVEDWNWEAIFTDIIGLCSTILTASKANEFGDILQVV